MKSSKVLEMINKGQIEELKVLLQDEIYSEVLNTNPSAKKRYAAMKRYFKYLKPTREILAKPCKIEYEGEPHISFCNAHSLALTSEPCGAIELCEDRERYPDVTRLISHDGVEHKIDFNKVFAEAKSKGYGLKKSELNTDKCQYLMHYDGAYFKIGLIDITYGIIDNGEEATVYHAYGNARSPILIKNNIGVCIVMPMAREDGYEDNETKIIIDVD